MAIKPRFRIRSAVLAATVTAICVFASASPTLAASGSVYFDANNNAAASDPAHLFNGTFTGSGNVGIGPAVMPALTTGSANVATGNNALIANTTGNQNIATGSAALFTNTTGSNNIASGSAALLANTTGSNDIANGTAALLANTDGDENIATGTFALDNNTTGSGNLALGFGAGENLTTGSDNIDIANAGKAGESKVMRLGTKGDQTRTYIAGISGRTVNGTGQAVVVNSQGQLGTAAASAKASAANPLSATVGRLVTGMQRQRRQIESQATRIERQGKEIRALRSQSG